MRSKKVNKKWVKKSRQKNPGKSKCASTPIYHTTKRLTLSAASIFVTEGMFMYIYFLLFEEKLSKSDFRPSLLFSVE